jgi:hypothetical protein
LAGGGVIVDYKNSGARASHDQLDSSGSVKRNVAPVPLA